MSTQFEDFSPGVSSTRPDVKADKTSSGNSTAERLHAMSAAIDAVINGRSPAELAVGGNDQIDALAKNLNRLFAALASPATQEHMNLAKNNARLEYLIANTPAIIYSSVPTGDFKMTFVSDNAARVLDYKPEEMLADQNFWFEHIHPDDIPGIFSSIGQVFTEGKRTYEYRFRTRDGRYLWMHDTLHLIRDADGNPVEVIGSLTDISDRKLMEDTLKKKGEEQSLLISQLQQTQAQLLQSEKMASIGQLAAGIAHEINNPIGFVNSNMSTLRTYVNTLMQVLDGCEQAVAAHSNTGEIAATIQKLKTESDLEFLRDDVVALVEESIDGLTRVKNIVQSLKDFSHVGESDWQFADLHQGIDSTLTIANNEFKYKAVVVREFGALPLVKCLVSQLNQVFMNLIVNASQAIKDSGVITIRTGCENDWVWLEFGDNGSGIPAENLSRIFEPFFTTKPVGKGTGLGLSLSYNIVAKHGGRIEVESQVGQGTRFTVHLPVNRTTA